ncbi:MAG: hypothetical protein JOZ55_09435 [Alphaproteobacteria bacterium]|nr:hypothetical protein [Alphaproteobacteria bacterium]
MAFFRNRTVNLLNLHYGIHAVAMSGGGAFYTVYLLKAGVPPAGVLLVLAAILLGRLCIRPIVVPLGIRFGIRPLVIAGILLSALQYPVIAEVRGVDIALVILVAVSSLADSIYWSSYHAYFAILGDQEHRGQQIGVREAIAAIVGIVSPIIGGILLVTFGPMVAFGATSVVAMSSAIPLFFTPAVPVARRSPGALSAAIPGVLLFATDGWICAGYFWVWQIALFFSLGQSFLAYGGALALAAVAGAAGAMMLGRHIDSGRAVRAVHLAFGGLFFAVALRAISLGHPAIAVIANAVGSLESCLYIPTLMTAVYNQAKRSPCTLRFHVLTEGGWDLGGATGCLVAAGLIASSLPLLAGICSSLAGAIAGLILLRRYYSQNPALAEDIPIPDAALPRDAAIS